MGLLIGRTSLSHGLSLGCSFVLSSMSCAVLQRLPRLSGLLCRKHRTFLGEIQCLFTLQHVILVPYKKQTFVSVIPAAVAGIVPLPRCSVLAAANSAVPAFSLSYLWPPGFPLPSSSWSRFCWWGIIQGLAVWFHFSLTSEKWQGCTPSHMGLGCQGLPLPQVSYPLAKSLYICPITYSWSCRSICWKVHLLKPDPGFVWFVRAFLDQSLLHGLQPLSLLRLGRELA